MSVEALVRSGLVVWTNVTLKEKFEWKPVESGHSVGWPHGQWVTRMQALTDAIAFGSGLLHAEWICPSEPAEPRLVECAGRAPGDKIVELINLAYRCSLREQQARCLCGQETDLAVASVAGAAIRFFGTATAGIAGFTDLAQDRAAELGVVELEFDVAPGTRVPVTDSSWTRHGHVLCVGDSPDEANERAAIACAAVGFEIRPSTGSCTATTP
ncbi:hypothetical protein SDC9_126241 [bioreactor metagenome]|uniref:L-amino acid ligase C-terminal domain-containing protein n=1 Tax=bioreactor metagenome TaxID=1076179 RepID=A0A645CQM9_9ZZZZ